MTTQTDRVMLRMRPFLLVTDIGFLLYWAVSVLMLLGFAIVPPEYMFKDYDDPVVNAWNWSFFPLDIVLSICGLTSLRLHARSHSAWLPLAIVSLSLTFCAGLMAVAFWAIRRDFDPVWWAMNVFLLAWPCWFAPGLFESFKPPKDC